VLRPFALVALLLAAGALSACGTKGQHEGDRVVRAETEGLYLDIGELKYQVQVSRQLNPLDTQDKSYLLGIPEAERELEPDEVWFAVFMQVRNLTKEPLQPSGDIEIVDTQEDIFTPLALAEENVFAYRSEAVIPPGHLLPETDTAAFDTPIQGAMLLFKLTLTALDNRPLELKIEGRKAPQQTGIFDLDV